MEEDIKPTRTTDDIKKEYAQYCAQVGENQYRIKVLEGQIGQLYQKISDLNTEAEGSKNEKTN